MKIAMKYEVNKRKEAAVRWIAWRLPKRLVMWCYFRVLAHATTGQYGKTVVQDLTAMDAIDRWPVK